MQGVGDLYTDPQIHTAQGDQYGDGNLGTRGMALFFHSHKVKYRPPPIPTLLQYVFPDVTADLKDF